MKRVAVIISSVLIAACLTGGLRILNLTKFQKNQQRQVEKICNFVQAPARVEASRAAFDQAYSLLKLEPVTQNGQIILKEGNNEIGSRFLSSDGLQQWTFNCDLRGLANTKLEFSFTEIPFFARVLVLNYVLIQSIIFLIILFGQRLLTFVVARERRRHRLEDEAKWADNLKRIIAQFKHDITGPLSALKVSLFSASNQLRDPDFVHTVINRAENIIADLDDSKQPNSDCSLDVLEVAISEIVAEKKQQVQSRIKINFEFDSSALTVAYVEPVHFRRVISNLIQNSIEAIPSSGSVRITLTKNNGQFAQITIQDTGVGIPSEVIESVFDRRFTFGKRGSGLGLSHAKSFVEKWRGKIQVESQRDCGATVAITLPIFQTEAQFVGWPTILADQSVIMVDDEPKIAGAIFKPLIQKQVMTPREFVDWFPDHAEASSHVFFFDFHLREKFTGIDIFRQVADHYKKFLMTSDYLNPELMKASAIEKIPIIPKPMLL